MTVIPFPSILPTPPSGLGTASGATADPAAAGFAALVASLVAGQLPAATTTTTPGVTPPTEATGPDGDATASEEETSADGTVVATLPLPGLAAMMSVAPVAAVGTPVPAATDAVTEAAGDAATAAAATGSTPTAATAVAPTGVPAAEAATTPGASTAPASSPAPASSSEAASTPEATSSPAPTGSAATAPGAATPFAATAPGTRAPAEAGPVTRQVFPEITRLMSTGNGTHRVTLSLQPEQLGEVRVTLTVRDGEVLVRMAAGDDAQRALLEGAPELRRVLELTGATDTRIVVRDLPGTTAPPQPSAPAAGEGRDGSGQAGDRANDQHAGTRGGSTARDGSNPGAGDGPTGGAAPPVPGRPVTGTRPAGLDVTI